MWRLLALSILFVSASAVAQEEPLIERFARLEAIRAVQLSPSGQKLLVVRQDRDGRYAVEVRETARLSAGGLDFGAAPAEVREARWLSENRILVLLRERVNQSSGPGFWGEFGAVFDARGNLIYRLPGQDPQIVSLSQANAAAIYLAYDSTGDGSADVHRVDVESGRSDRIFRGNNRRFGFQVDRRGQVRISATFNPDDFAVTYWARGPGETDWERVATISPSERTEFRPLGFLTDSDDELTVVSSRESDTAGLYIYNLKERRITREIYSEAGYDIDNVVVSNDGFLVGVRSATDYPKTIWVDPARAAVAKSLEKVMPGLDISVGNPTPAGLSLVTISGSRDPGSYYLLDGENRLQLLGAKFPSLASLTPASVTFVRYQARDGLELPMYVTRPAQMERPAPLIIMPHGGPWTRDFGSWDEWAQLFAAQGYVVAQPQFRGSRGFGRQLWIAGDREWGAKMQDDLDDAIVELVRSGDVDPSRVAMVGWSYGGYAALTAAWRGNGLYRCVIAGAAVSDLRRINAGLAGDYILRRIQKPTIVGPSPVDRLKDANIPVLVIHGDIDQTVPVIHGREAARALKEAGKRYRYVEVKGLDHQLDKFSEAHKAEVYGEMDRWLSGPCGMNG
jgi:dipeptidyl aminopeptidase/acylaminoacyl peptidase